MATEIRRMALRRGTAAEWTTANPILLAGEEGYETDTGKRKVGDGVTAWSTLDYDGVVDTQVSSNGLVYSYVWNATDSAWKNRAGESAVDATRPTGISWSLKGGPDPSTVTGVTLLAGDEWREAVV